MRKIITVLIIIITLFNLTACASPAADSTPSGTSTPIITETLTPPPMPSPTFEPTPSPTPKPLTEEDKIISAAEALYKTSSYEYYNGKLTVVSDAVLTTRGYRPEGLDDYRYSDACNFIMYTSSCGGWEGYYDAYGLDQTFNNIMRIFSDDEEYKNDRLLYGYFLYRGMMIEKSINLRCRNPVIYPDIQQTTQEFFDGACSIFIDHAPVTIDGKQLDYYSSGPLCKYALYNYLSYMCDTIKSNNDSFKQTDKHSINELEHQLREYNIKVDIFFESIEELAPCPEGLEIALSDALLNDSVISATEHIYSQLKGHIWSGLTLKAVSDIPLLGRGYLPEGFDDERFKFVTGIIEKIAPLRAGDNYFFRGGSLSIPVFGEMFESGNDANFVADITESGDSVYWAGVDFNNDYSCKRFFDDLCKIYIMKKSIIEGRPEEEIDFDSLSPMCRYAVNEYMNFTAQILKQKIIDKTVKIKTGKYSLDEIIQISGDMRETLKNEFYESIKTFEPCPEELTQAVKEGLNDN